MRHLGQHFLKNKSILKNIVRSLGAKENDVVIEIGPGHGELTREVLKAVQGIELYAIERDEKLAELLQNGLLQSEFFHNEAPDAAVKIIPGDALKILPELVGNLSPKQQYKIVGNIPYYITGKLLRIVGELAYKPERAVFMIQREVAERICAVPLHMNKLAAIVQFWAAPEIVGLVSKNSFSPPPEVESAVIVLKTRQDMPGAFAAYEAAVQKIFAQPRKTILNNVIAGENIKEPKQSVKEKLEGIGVSPESRPQDLSIIDIQAVARLFF